MSPTPIRLALVALLLAGESTAEEFEPNHVFWAGYDADAIFEFDETGDLVRTLDVGGGR